MSTRHTWCFIIACLTWLSDSNADILNVQRYSPFKVIDGTSAELNVIKKTLKCDETPELGVGNCGTKCLKNEKMETGCPGFIVDSADGNKCTLCQISKIQDIQNSRYTPLTNEHMVVLLSTEESTVPEVSMNFDEVNPETITGINTMGATTNVCPSDYVDGINGKSLYLHDGGKVRLTGSEHAC